MAASPMLVHAPQRIGYFGPNGGGIANVGPVGTGNPPPGSIQPPTAQPASPSYPPSPQAQAITSALHSLQGPSPVQRLIGARNALGGQHSLSQILAAAAGQHPSSARHQLGPEEPAAGYAPSLPAQARNYAQLLPLIHAITGASTTDLPTRMPPTAVQPSQPFSFTPSPHFAY